MIWNLNKKLSTTTAIIKQAELHKKRKNSYI